MTPSSPLRPRETVLVRPGHPKPGPGDPQWPRKRHRGPQRRDCGLISSTGDGGAAPLPLGEGEREHGEKGTHAKASLSEMRGSWGAMLARGRWARERRPGDEGGHGGGDDDDDDGACPSSPSCTLADSCQHQYRRRTVSLQCLCDRVAASPASVPPCSPPWCSLSPSDSFSLQALLFSLRSLGAPRLALRAGAQAITAGQGMCVRSTSQTPTSDIRRSLPRLAASFHRRKWLSLAWCAAEEPHAALRCCARA